MAKDKGWSPTRALDRLRPRAQWCRFYCKRATSLPLGSRGRPHYTPSAIDTVGGLHRGATGTGGLINPADALSKNQEKLSKGWGPLQAAKAERHTVGEPPCMVGGVWFLRGLVGRGLWCPSYVVEVCCPQKQGVPLFPIIAMAIVDRCDPGLCVVQNLLND